MMQEYKDHDQPVICTITTKSHLGLARCLMDSFLRHHPNGRGYVLHLDGMGLPGVFDHANVTSVSAEELRIPEFYSMLSRYSTFEMCNALKPFLLQYLLAHTDYQKLCYFDADIFIFAALKEEIWDELDSGSILLTPHLYQLPDEDQNLVWRDLSVLQHGVFNGGFIGLRRSPEAEEFLRWWGSRTVNCGYKKLEEGMNCDQRWLDLVPGFGLNVRVSRHPGLNAAYWNLHERRFEFAGGHHFVNGEPLKFFHFSGYSPDNPDSITKNWTRFTFENRPDVKPAFDEYLHHLKLALTEAPRVVEQVQEAKTDLYSPVPAKPESASHIQLKEPENAGQSFFSAPEPTTLERREAASRRVASGDSPPRVSVVIPAFNAAHHIRQAVESVLDQTLESLEIIVVDDGSTDDTRAVLAPYSDRLQLFSQRNSGVSMARNRGTQAARGEFVAFLDADDYFLLPTKLEEQVACFDARSDVGIVHSGWRTIDEEGTIVVEKEPWKYVPYLDLKGWLLWQAALPSAMMFRRDALMSVGGFDSRLAHLEDVDVALRMALRGYGTAWLEKITVAYRQHGANASQKIREQAEALELVLDAFFAQGDLPDDIQGLENEVRYSTLVWIACQFHCAGYYDEMAQSLRQSLHHSALSTGTTLLDWIERFRFTYYGDFGRTLSVFELTDLGQWQQIVRTQLIGITPDEAFFPPSEKKWVAWSIPRGRKSSKVSPPSTSILTTAPLLLDDEASSNGEAPTIYPAKINLTRALEADYGRHRSGWAIALQSLRPLHHDGGVLVDAFVEHTFDRLAMKPLIAHQEPWIGFLHNPPNIPEWFCYQQSPQSLLASEPFQESLHYCLGLFCLSEYHKHWLEKHLDLPIIHLIHPSEIAERKFSMENFLANPDKKIVQVGSWLRKLHSIYYLPVTRLKRAIVHQHVPYIDDLFATEKKAFRLDPDYGSVEVLEYLSDAQYDDLLARNVVFVELYDSSANNTVIECMVRGTPVLVNPLPAVKEYLGEDYPFYFVNRSQAARKAEDTSLIEEAHRYLKDHPLKEKLSVKYFLKSVADSGIYRNLPSVKGSCEKIEAI